MACFRAEKKCLTYRVTFLIIGYMNTYTTYWSNPNGAIICSNHAGNYLRSAIQAHPKRMEHDTPLGTYELISDEEIEWCEEEFGYSCETCKHENK